MALEASNNDNIRPDNLQGTSIQLDLGVVPTIGVAKTNENRFQ